MSEMGEGPEVPEVPDVDAAPLSGWERLSASVLGVGLAGAGGVAVFITTNQAGSVALLLVGVVLLIMAINGAPLTRARYQDYELFMSRRRHRVVENIRDEPPEEARQALQVLNTIDPGASRDPVVARASGYLLELEVVDRLQRLHPEIEVSRGPLDYGVDAVVPLNDRRIGVEVKGGSGDVPLRTADLRRVVNRVIGSPSRLGGAHVDGLLIVTNRVLPTELSRRIRELSQIMPIGVVRWVDAQDDQALEDALGELSRRRRLSD
ncbi:MULTISPECIES: hypothetical protein [unclassified Streptomyces]|uniref:hypothetical protein n=1 Tax=unclassified Streptomyces TaxID=2593676 RepID=UPI002E180C69